MSASVFSRAAGLSLLFGVALAAHVLGPVVSFVSPLLIAVFLGAIVVNTIGVPAWAEKGVSTHKLFLQSAIVLLGVRISLEALLETGPTLITLVVFVVFATLLTVEVTATMLASLPRKLGSMLAAGVSICGTSAVAAVAASIEPEEEHFAYAIGTILLFDAIGLIAFPSIGRVLDLSPAVFGTWVGLSMFSTGPVTAVGFSYHPVAGEWATITKLARNTLIGVVALGYTVWYLQQKEDVITPSQLTTIASQFPIFVFGFVAMILLSSLNAFSAAQAAFLSRVSEWFFLFAFAGLGLEIRFERVRSTGYVPFLVALVGLLSASTLSLGLILLFL